MRVLIVDDEALFREHLRHEIPWTEWGLELAGEARNGVEALELAAATRPQIVFADINMPLMNGLELTASLAQRVPDCRVVIVSAHDQFDFARQAMQHGVRHYLLKPFDQDDLRRCLAELVPALQKEERIRGLEAEQRKTRRDAILGNLLKAGDQAEVLTILERASLRLPAEGEDVLWQAAFVLAAEESFALNDQQAAFSDAGNLVLVGWESAQGPRTFEAMVHRGPGPAGLGGAYQDGAALARSLEDAGEALKRAVFFGVRHVLKSTPEPSRQSSLSEDTGPLLQALVLAVTMKQAAEAQRTLAALVGLISPPATPVALVRQLGHQILHHLSQVLADQGGAARAFGTLNPAREVESSETFGGWTDLLRSWVDRTVGTLLEAGTRYTKIVVQVRRFLGEHFQDPDLSMETIAGSVGLHASSLRSIFRKETGATVMDSLLEIRMNRARELLAQGRLKHSAIAAEVGFSDPTYFSRCFKKVFSISPSEYEDSLSRPPS